MSWRDALPRATLSLTGRKKIPPGLPKRRELADLQRRSGRKTASSPMKSKTSPTPEHIIRNIERVSRAEEERKLTGGTLPTTSFVRGGTMIKK